MPSLVCLSMHVYMIHLCSPPSENPGYRREFLYFVVIFSALWFSLFPNRNIVAFLLEHEKWEEMLRSSNRESATPLRGLIAFMPGKLNHCTTQGSRYKLKIGKGGLKRGHQMREACHKFWEDNYTHSSCYSDFSTLLLSWQLQTNPWVAESSVM